MMYIFQTEQSTVKLYTCTVYIHDHGIQSHHFMEKRWRNSGNNADFILGATKSLQMVTAAMKLKDTCSLEEKL